MTAMSLMKRFIRSASRRHRGSATWLFSAYVMLFVLILYMIWITAYRINMTVDYVSNTVTSSALAGVVCDPQAHASNSTLLISDVRAADSKIREYILKNLAVSSFYEDNPHFDRLSECTIDRVIIYNHTGTAVNISEFDRFGNLCVQETVAEAYTPTGERVTKTGCFVQFTFPVGILGEKIKITKGSQISAWL